MEEENKSGRRLREARGGERDVYKSNLKALTTRLRASVS